MTCSGFARQWQKLGFVRGGSADERGAGRPSREIGCTRYGTCQHPNHNSPQDFRPAKIFKGGSMQSKLVVAVSHRRAGVHRVASKARADGGITGRTRHKSKRQPTGQWSAEQRAAKRGRCATRRRSAAATRGRRSRTQRRTQVGSRLEKAKSLHCPQDTSHLGAHRGCYRLQPQS